MRVFTPVAVLFLHAFPLSKEMFSSQMEVLEREGIPYVAVDYPGFGEERPLPGELTVERITDFVLSKISSLGIKRLVPVGDSMGGYVIFDMFRRYKDMVKGAVFVSTRAEADTEEQKKVRYETMERVRREGTAFLIETMLENQTSPATKKDQEKMSRLRCMMEKATREGIIKTLKALAERRDNRDLLPEIDVPVLVVAGKDDEKVTPPEVVRRIAEGIKGAEYKEIKDSAHLPPFENPEEFNELLLSFLRKVL